MKDFEPDEGLALARTNSDKITKIDKELKRIDKKVDDQGRRIDTLSKMLANDGQKNLHYRRAMCWQNNRFNIFVAKTIGKRICCICSS